MKFRLTVVLPKADPAEPDVRELKVFEVVDPLPTWHWDRGLPVCNACQADREGYGGMKWFIRCGPIGRAAGATAVNGQ